MSREKRGIDAFNADVAANDGYLYSTRARLSSVMSNRRQTEAALALADLHHLRVLDIGCGDGVYTIELFDLCNLAMIHGIDPAEEAVRIAEENACGRDITFRVCGAERLPYDDDSFDIAYIRGVLHHVDDPLRAIREALRVATRLLIIEPNGYCPVLKLFERLSNYHLKHQERSYTLALFQRWASQAQAEIRKQAFVGLVPLFCPDWMAKVLKQLEPFVERTPIARSLACGANVMLMERCAAMTDARPSAGSATSPQC